MPEEAILTAAEKQRAALYASMADVPVTPSDKGEEIPAKQNAESAAPAENGEPEKTSVELEYPHEEEDPPVVKEEDRSKKTVPLAALDEARVANKKMKAEIRQLKQQVADLVVKRTSEFPAPGADNVDLESMSPLEKKVYLLEQQISKLNGKTEADSVKKFQAETETLVSKVSADLEAEGFPGFSDFRVQVGKALEADGAEDEDYANPEELKRVYREIVYPKLIALSRSQKNAAKDAKKVGANLITRPGSNDTKKEEEEKPNTFDNYIKGRKIIY